MGKPGRISGKNSELSSLFLFVLSLCLLVSGCEQQAPHVQQTVLSGPIMGTDYRITLLHDRGVDTLAVEAEILLAMQRVNQSMSNYIENSEVSVFNAAGAQQVHTLSEEFRAVIAESLEISKRSQGAFDVTVGKLVNLWGFGPDGSITKSPSEGKIEALRDSIGYQKLKLEGNRLSKSHAELKINVSAIAKGFAVDQVAEILKKLSFDRFLVNIGGELRAAGRSLSGELWRVGIEKPHILGGIQQIAVLDNQSIATSGDYRNYLIIDGKQFSHTIDPKTLKPVLHKLALASVISDQTSTADAMATALMAMGDVRAVDFVEREGIAAYLLIRGDKEGEYIVHISEEFKSNLQ